MFVESYVPPLLYMGYSSMTGCVGGNTCSSFLQPTVSNGFGGLNNTIDVEQ